MTNYLLILKVKETRELAETDDMIKRRKYEIKECLNTAKQVFFHYQVGSLVDNRAYKPYTLVGPPAL